MAVETEYDYDVFISYQSGDRPWAVKLSEDLKEKGLKVFLDQDGLRAGGVWREQLLDQLKNSRQLVCLWSDAAENSSWVSKELYYFDNSHADSPSNVSGSSIFVLLDNDNVTHNHLQLISGIKDAKATVGGKQVTVYDASVADRGVSKLDLSEPGLWPRVVEQVYQGVTLGNSVPIPLLILTTTQDRLSKVDPNEAPAHIYTAASLDQLTKSLGITMATLLEGYGEHRTNWKPWGSGEDIINILNAERDRINNLPNATEVRWDPIGEDFWSGDPKRTETAIRKLLQNPAVIVVDPISLYDGMVYNRFSQLSGCWENPLAIFIVLPPFSLPTPSRVFREAIEKISLDMFRDYYEPGVRRLPSARCNVNFGDDKGIGRSLLTTLRNHFHQVQVQTAVTLATMSPKSGRRI